MTSLHWHATKRGFSLVEMAFALAILVFAVFAIYSLLPTGLKISRQARGDLRGTEIMAMVTEDFRLWKKMTNGASKTPFYGLPTGFDYTNGRFTAAEQISLVIYQDGSTNQASGERFVAAITCYPISKGLASRANISIIRGQGAKATFSGSSVAYENEEGAAFTSLILDHPAP
jgi:uncharacterized protein (TIGR02598 family)